MHLLDTPHEFADERLRALWDLSVPMVREDMGFEPADTEWPAGIPPAIVARMAALAREAVDSPEVRRRFEEGGATVWWTTPEGLADFRRENQARFAPVIIASGARVE